MPLNLSPKKTPDAPTNEVEFSTPIYNPLYPLFRGAKRNRSDNVTDYNENHATNDDEDPTQKRTINEVFNLMKEMQQENRSTSKHQIKKIDELRNDVAERFSSVNTKITTIEEKINVTNSTVASLQSRMNGVEQDQLAMHMDITGITKEEAERNKSDPASLARGIIKSFKIALEPQAIQRAYIKVLNKANKAVVVVVFTSVEHKLNVMKSKRAVKENRNIFFDHSMTAATRELFFKARFAAKDSRAKSAFLSNGRVFIAVDDNTKVRINSTADLDQFKPAASPNNATNF